MTVTDADTFYFIIHVYHDYDGYHLVYNVSVYNSFHLFYDEFLSRPMMGFEAGSKFQVYFIDPLSLNPRRILQSMAHCKAEQVSRQMCRPFFSLRGHVRS